MSGSSVGSPPDPGGGVASRTPSPDAVAAVAALVGDGSGLTAGDPPLGWTVLGPSFRNHALESAFREHHARASLGAFRLGMLASIAAWCVGSVVASRIFPEYTLSYLVAGWGVMAPLLFLGWSISRFERWHSQLVVWGAGLNCLAGILLVLIVDFDVAVLRGVGLGLMILVAFFSFTIFQLRWIASLAAVLVYYAFFQGQLSTRWLEGDVGAIEHAGYSFVLWFTFGVGAYVVASLEHSRRDSFVKSCVIEVQKERILEEQARSEALLLDILPQAIAERLKGGERVIADAFDEATILFADIVGFTALSERISAERLVALLDRIFTAFDGLVDAHGVEKIKTIGDAYMVAAGVPEPRGDHAEAIARLAREMVGVVARTSKEDDVRLEIRVGIHSGPVVAGVIGKRKFAYDLWGDAVNTASRMESHGVPGRIHLSQATAERIGGSLEIVERGPVEIKGKGSLRTYFLAGPEV